MENHRNSRDEKYGDEYYSDKTLSTQTSFWFKGNEMSRLTCVVRKVDLALSEVDLKFLWIFLCRQGLNFIGNLFKKDIFFLEN